MKLVVDASVALKWFFRERDDEADIAPGLELLAALDAGRITMLQPPHFLAEVAAVLAREKPDTAHDDLADLQLVDWHTVEDPSIHTLAIDLARDLRQHVFHTLYHATALHEPDTTLVTADQRYYATAHPRGRIHRLPASPLTACLLAAGKSHCAPLAIPTRQT